MVVLRNIVLKVSGETGIKYTSWTKYPNQKKRKVSNQGKPKSKNRARKPGNVKTTHHRKVEDK